jgi:glycolate oxidase FAD binding subunit
MSEIFYPKDEQDVSDFVFDSFNKNNPIEIIGHGSKKIGRIIQCSQTLSLKSMNGILEYFPEELYIKVLPGTPLNFIESALKEKNQNLGFEPNDLGYIYKGQSDPGSIGGVVSCNLSGPGRFKNGALRDHVLGFKAVNGSGAKIKSGGTVVKNVTGYDLSKIVTGSYGTLCAITEINLKVSPIPDFEETFVINNLNYIEAIDIFIKALDSSLEISGACFFSEDNVSFLTLNDVKKDTSILGLRIQGPKPSVVERIQVLNKMFKDQPTYVLDAYQTAIFWREIKNLEGYANSENFICKISLPITNMGNFLKYFQNLKFKYFLDWGGNIAWCEIYNNSDLDQIRIFCLKHDGYLTVIKANDNFRQREDFLTNSNSNLKILSKKLKESFDPKSILNPNKMYLGI